MTKRIRTAGGIVLLAGLMGHPAIAHHSFTATYAPDKPMKVTGKVTEMKWVNPHGWIHVDVTGPDGKVTNWAFETGGANSLIRRGWKKEDLPAGTVLIIEGWAARNGAPTGNASSITYPDGRRLFSGSSNPAAQETP